MSDISILGSGNVFSRLKGLSTSLAVLICSQLV